ncbi:hypothetical protein [Spirosoma sp. 209]|uniref:hypothetical protein n=1 Tax=Spirosoma sp. 209 TaxID=1955701 RepID=UPI00098D2874|nr:hypothetical protein [Spirosoma sp. 209]
MEYDFGKKIEKLLTERGNTKKSLYDHLKMTANGFDGMVKNNSITASRLAEISQFFDVPVSYFYGEEASYTKKSDNKNSFGEEVLTRMADDLETLRKVFEDQLRAKDRQIEKLLDLLGKLEGAIEQPLLSGQMTFTEMYKKYTAEVAQQFDLPYAGQILPSSPLFTAMAEQKLVAPRSQTTRTRQ